MIRFEISIIRPELDSFSEWLGLPQSAKDNMECFITAFNESEKSFIKRAYNWAGYNRTQLSVEKVSARENADKSGFTASILISNIDICGVAKALGVPSPVAVIAAHMGERGVSSAMNTLLKLNRGIISAEAVRQLRKRGMNAEAVYGSILNEKKHETGVT